MPQNTQEQILARREKVSELYLQGMRLYEIAKQVNVSPSQISQDVEWIEDEWLKKTLFNFNDAKLLELKRIDNLEAQAWRDYMASDKTLTKNSKKFKFLKANAAKSSPKTLKNTKRDDYAEGEYEESEATESKLRDPRYLLIIVQCIRMRMELLQLSAFPLKGGTELLDANGDPIAEQKPQGNTWVVVDMSQGEPIPDIDSDYREQQ